MSDLTGSILTGGLDGGEVLTGGLGSVADTAPVDPVVAALAAAVSKLSSMVAATVYPILSTGDLTEILQDHQNFTVWAASTAYNVGDVVIPTVANGRGYRCVLAGTSGATEPAWYYVTRLGNRWWADYACDPILLDEWLLGGLGSSWEPGSARWQDDGAVTQEFFDLTGAARDAWMRKAAMVAAKYDVSSAQQRMMRSQMYDHCVRQANRYAPVYLI